MTAFSAQWLPPGAAKSPSPINEKESSESSSVAPRAPPMSMQYCTAIFSFLYHLTGYDPGAEAVLACGLTEALLSVVDDYAIPVHCITFVTRAVRVLDLITNMEVQAFQQANGVHILLKRLNVRSLTCGTRLAWPLR